MTYNIKTKFLFKNKFTLVVKTFLFINEIKKDKNYSKTIYDFIIYQLSCKFHK